MSELVRFGVSLEKELLEAFDGLCRRRGYANRSEALRHVLRRELDEEAISDPAGPVAGVLTLVYDHHESDLPRRLTALQHESHEAVQVCLHIHLDHSRCLEVMALRGQGGPVRELADRLRACRGILRGSLSLMALESDGTHIHQCGAHESIPL